MNRRLDKIQNWSELAQGVGWSAAALADKCGVCVRTLERHFRDEMGKCPQEWLSEQRHGLAKKLLSFGLVSGSVDCITTVRLMEYGRVDRMAAG